jgi:dUTP pyrophosphatase
MIFMPEILFNPKHLKKEEHELAYQTQDSACFDIFADIGSPITIQPGKRTLISSGMYLNNKNYVQLHDIPEYCSLVLNIRPRSGLAFKHCIDVGAGEIDIDYVIPNEIGVLLINNGQNEFVITPGMRIAQARWGLTITAFGVKTLQVKREAGFGSTNT